jgi:hypothetical protein
MAFQSAEDRIDEDDFETILAILGGKSLWQGQIRANLPVMRKNLPEHPFRIISAGEFTKVMHNLGEAPDDQVPGITDKRNGIIYLKEFFGVNSRAARLGIALHEAVHLVSHRPGRGGGHSIALGPLGEGLMEGLVECITSNILASQGIKLAKPEGRGHQQRVPVAAEFIRRMGDYVPGRVLFAGDFQFFLNIMHYTYSVAGWLEIQRTTTANDPARALRRMEELRAAEEQRHAAELERLWRQIPKRTVAPQNLGDSGYIFKRGVSPPPPVRY